MTIDEVAAVLSDVLGRTIRYEPASALGYAATSAARVWWWSRRWCDDPARGPPKGDAEPVTDTVERLLGRPARTVREYITDHAADVVGERLEVSVGRDTVRDPGCYPSVPTRVRSQLTPMARTMSRPKAMSCRKGSTRSMLRTCWR